MDDPFAVLGLPRAWNVTVEEIRAAQRTSCIAAHPDRQTDPVARANALQLSSRINAAATELLDALSRGAAIVRVLAPTPRPSEPKQDATFLMRMMELREAVDQASDNALARSAVAAQIAQELQAIEMETDVAMRELITRPHAQTWTAAVDALNRLRALRRAHEERAR